MPSSTEAETVCLDVAIDHRIRRLFRPVHQDSDADVGSHVSIIEARGRALRCPKSEISVTKTLARPATKGGIVVMLQQPRGNHPFDEGVDEVITDCDTLFALYKLFLAASCDTLDIRTDVSVIDLLPYISEQDQKDIPESELRRSFQAAYDAICAKTPDVVLCAGKIWLPYAGKKDDRKGDAWKLENIGVGKTFENKYESLWLRDDDNRLFKTRRVNGFHPSHAVNYHPHRSCLRQLQMLIAAETCGVFRGDWEEETWMPGLRSACARSTAKRDAAAGETSRSGAKYLPDYEELYSANLRKIYKVFTDVSCSCSDGEPLYYELVASRLSEECNDTSLMLRQMAELERRGWEEKYKSWNRRVLQTIAANAVVFADQSWKRLRFRGNAEFTAVFRSGAAAVRACVTRAGRSDKIDLRGAAKAFLGMAEGLEVLMGDLLDEELDEENEELYSAEHDPLTDLFGGLNMSR